MTEYAESRLTVSRDLLSDTASALSTRALLKFLDSNIFLPKNRSLAVIAPQDMDLIAALLSKGFRLDVYEDRRGPLFQLRSLAVTEPRLRVSPISTMGHDLRPVDMVLCFDQLRCFRNEAP